MGNKELIEVVNAPRKIYLQLGDESEHVDDIADGRLDFHSIVDDVTWSSLDDDELSVAYVLQSDYAELKAENARLRAQIDWTPVSIRPLPNDRSVTATVEHCTHKSRFVVELKKRDCVDGILSGVFKVIAWREIPQAWEGNRNENLYTT